MILSSDWYRYWYQFVPFVRFGQPVRFGRAVQLARRVPIGQIVRRLQAEHCQPVLLPNRLNPIE